MNRNKAYRGSRTRGSSIPGDGTQAGVIAGILLEEEKITKAKGYPTAGEAERKARSRVSVRYFSWEAPQAHSYRDAERML